MARVPLIQEQNHPEFADAIEKYRAGRRGKLINIYRMLLNAPPLAESWFNHSNTVRWNTTLDGRLREILAGIPAGSRAAVETEPDRAAAIRRAVSLAGPGDLVVIAGKGHEKGDTGRFRYEAGIVVRGCRCGERGGRTDEREGRLLRTHLHRHEQREHEKHLRGETLSPRHVKAPRAAPARPQRPTRRSRSGPARCTDRAATTAAEGSVAAGSLVERGIP